MVINWLLWGLRRGLWWANVKITWHSPVQVRANLSGQPVNENRGDRRSRGPSIPRRPLDGTYSTDQGISDFIFKRVICNKTRKCTPTALIFWLSLFALFGSEPIQYLQITDIRSLLRLAEFLISVSNANITESLHMPTQISLTRDAPFMGSH